MTPAEIAGRLTKRQRETLAFCAADEDNRAWGAPRGNKLGRRPSAMGGAFREMLWRMEVAGLLDDEGRITELGRRALAARDGGGA